MKKLAGISMFVAVTGLCFAGTGTAQSSMDSQDQYSRDNQGPGRLMLSNPFEIQTKKRPTRQRRFRV